MKIVKIEKVGKKQVYDISVEGAEHYVLENGVVTHNTGLIYSANQAFIIGKSQEKDGTELLGWNFTLNAEKSRFVREKAKMTFRVLYGSGIQKYSGLLDLALSAGLVQKPSNGWYSRVDSDGVIESKKWRAKETDTSEFWAQLLDDPRFDKWIGDNFKLSSGTMPSPDIIDEDDTE